MQKKIIEETVSMLSKEAMETLRQLVDTNSYSQNYKGLRKTADIIAETANRHHLPLKPVPASDNANPSCHLTNSCAPDIDTPFYGVIGHFDTVHRPESTFNQLIKDGERLYGPGIFDMKAGIVAALYGLFAVMKIKDQVTIPVKIVFNADEETGSKNSRKLIEQEMKGAAGVFVFEGRNESDHALVTSRKGILMGSMEVTGIAAHAGKDPQKGASAIIEAAHKIIALDRLTNFSTGTILTTGTIRGGKVANQIPDSCQTDIDIRFQTPEMEMLIREKVAEILSETTVKGTSTTYDLECARPVYAKTEGTDALLNHYLHASKEFGFFISEKGSGGGSDGNFTAAMGIPTLDGLGPEGAGAHTEDEYIVKKSLLDSIKVFALFLSKLIK